MALIEIDVPDATAQAAHDAGLLTPHRINELLQQAIRRHAADELLSVADRVAAAGIEPMRMEEVNALIK